jgi:hypothetical protein
MPSFTGHDNEFPRPCSVVSIKRELGYLLLHGLTFAIATVEHRRESSRFSEVVAFEKLDYLTCDIHSTGGVDSRCDSKSDVIARHLRCAIGNFHQRFQAVVFSIRKIAKPKSDDRAILSCELHDVGDGSYRGDLHECRNKTLLSALA